MMETIANRLYHILLQTRYHNAIIATSDISNFSMKWQLPADGLNINRNMSEIFNYFNKLKFL